MSWQGYPVGRWKNAISGYSRLPREITRHILSDTCDLSILCIYTVYTVYIEYVHMCVYVYTQTKCDRLGKP